VINKYLQKHKSGHWWQWTILAILALGVLLIPIPVSASTPVDRIFRVEADRFDYNPAILTVNPDDRVTIELVATDVVHGLSIDGYDVETSVDPGQTVQLTFVANREGTFRFHCTTTCGNMHPFMSGKLEVGRNTLLWRSIVLVGLAFFIGTWKRRT
jgi:heme/copper-type cytochrome/quinol oxidase subunit 2